LNGASKCFTQKGQDLKNPKKEDRRQFGEMLHTAAVPQVGKRLVGSVFMLLKIEN